MEKFSRQCEWCHETFETEWPTKVYCKRQHKDSARRFRAGTRRHKVQTIIIRICKGCALHFETNRTDKVYCSTHCREWYVKQLQAERDREYDNQRTPAFKRRLYFKTDGRCGICKELIDLAVKYPEPKSFSIDHIVPRSQGGSHAFDNLQPAHLDCNAKRQDKPL